MAHTDTDESRPGLKAPSPKRELRWMFYEILPPPFLREMMPCMDFLSFVHATDRAHVVSLSIAWSEWCGV